MQLKDALNATAWLVTMRKAYGHEIPLPNAMAALAANSRATLYRRLRELNTVGFRLEIDGDFLKVWEIPEGAAAWADLHG